MKIWERQRGQEVPSVKMREMVEDDELRGLGAMLARQTSEDNPKMLAVVDVAGVRMRMSQLPESRIHDHKKE